MKPILLSILLLFVTKPAFSQIPSNDKTIFLDSSFVETGLQNYVYHRIIRNYKTKKENYIVNDYYKSGSILMTATSTTRDYLTKEGQCVFYYENGNKKLVSNFVKNRPTGTEFIWYENGNHKQEGQYIPDENAINKFKYKINQFWNAEGVQKVTDGNGEYEDVGKKFVASGNVKNGFKHGVWKGWVENQNIKYTESYKDGQFITGKIVDENNVEKTYNVLEKTPEPKKGIMDFYQYIGRNYNTPYYARDLSGKIYVTFVVDKDGKITEPKIIRDLGFGTGEEAVRILTNCKNWNPGEQRGRKVKVLYSLPITLQPSQSSRENKF